MRGATQESGQFGTQMKLSMSEYGAQKRIPSIVFIRRDKKLKLSQKETHLKREYIRATSLPQPICTTPKNY